MPPLASRLVASALVLFSTQRGGAQEATPNAPPTGSRNLLAQEKSPYLVQHATNPVHWMPWGEAAFERARTQNKPIFLSIGYSTCHWCHVMAHESFEDEATAALLNQSFVCIKVDREERPDVDRLYMSYVQATTGSGGWPMSVWLTPDLQPFFGGTYFPPADRFNRPGFPSLLKRITEAWETDRPRIVESAAATLASLAETAQSAARSGALSGAVLEAGFQSLVQQYDAEYGGFAKAPKFPRPATLFFLLQHASLAGAQARDGKIAAGMALHTLRNMYLGGMHDQLGGGFHRYSVDRLWHVPHYEKMLYDQAQLVCAYLEAHQLTGDALCAEAARSTLDYVAREMTDPTGGFHSAEDADSLFAHGKPEHGEGAYYVWTSGEIDSLLGPHSTFFKQVYAIEPEGNSPAGSDPHGELKGKNTLVRRRSPAEAAALSSLGETASEALLFNCREKLLAARAQRPRPHRDDKILTAWNGLMISAFARGYTVLGKEPYLTAARNAALFVKSTLWKDETLRRSYRKGPGEVPGFSEDYAFLIQGLLDLFEADFQPQWLAWALELQRVQDRLFWDASGGGYFSSASGDAAVLIRMKEDHDGAEPAASSVAARNLQRLAEFTGRADLRERASKTVQAFGAVLERAPAALPQMLQSLGGLQTPWRQIVIAGDLSAPDTRALLAVVRRAHLPNTILLHAGSASGTKQLGERLEAASQMPPLGGRATAYVCKDFTCQAPVCEPEALEALLKK
jgi:uncharacterized protein YyaL (SSP411 family)